MLKGVLDFSNRNRCLIGLLTILVAAVGVNSLIHLPIDARSQTG